MQDSIKGTRWVPFILYVLMIKSMEVIRQYIEILMIMWDDTYFVLRIQRIIILLIQIEKKF